MTSYIDFPDLLGFAPLAQREWEQAGMPKDPVRMPASSKTAQEALELLQAVCSDDTITLAALRNTLVDRLIIASNGDVAPATVLTGCSVAHSRTPPHYATMNTRQIVAAYCNALSPVGFEARPAPSAPTFFIGAKRNPTQQSVADLLSQLRSTIATGQDTAALSAFIVYSQAGLHLGTGARPQIRRLLPWATDRLGVLVLPEKARFPYHERPVPTPQIVLDQLSRHVRTLSWLFPRWSPDTDGMFPHVNAGGKLDGDLNPLKTDAITSAHGFDLELYALRRFVRSQLSAMRVSGEDIDAFMGHWCERSSPFDHLSTYPPRRLFALAEGPLTDMLRSVGYCVASLVR